jgi:hypothetical protein
MKVFFTIAIGVLIWLVKNFGVIGAFDSNFVPLFDKILLNILVVVCIISLGTVIFDIIPLREWVYYFIRKRDKKNVAIMVGGGQIIELDQKKLRIIHIINDIQALLQIISFVFVGILASLIAFKIFYIQIIISEMASEFIFTIILIIFCLTLLASGAFSIYVNHESKQIGM